MLLNLPRESYGRTNCISRLSSLLDSVKRNPTRECLSLEEVIKYVRGILTDLSLVMNTGYWLG
jgi:hypothetical protein